MHALPSIVAVRTISGRSLAIAVSGALAASALVLVVGAGLVEMVAMVAVAAAAGALAQRMTPASSVAPVVAAAPAPAPSPSRIAVDALEDALGAMSSPDPDEARAALASLAAHGRTRLIPALVLRHPHPAVLRDALALIAVPSRTDWIPLAQRLVNHPSSHVRNAARAALDRVGDAERWSGAAAWSAARERVLGGVGQRTVLEAIA